MTDRMQMRKRTKLEATGWVVGSAKSFLALSEEEAAYVETKVLLGESLRAARATRRLSQSQVAKRLGSSQSRVAKMEAADPSVSLDLLMRSLFKLGAGPGDIAKALRPRRKVAPV